MMRNKIILIGGLLLLLLLMSGLAIARPEALSLSWWTIDGGGGTAVGGDMTLMGTIGQPDAGSLTGGQYTLTGGFWSPDTGRVLFLPVILTAP